MVKKEKQSQPDSMEGIEQALTRTEQFIEDNSKVLSYLMAAIVVVVVLYIGAQRYYITPLQEEAAGQMFMAEKFFERDSFDLALNGYGTYPGFIEITEDYRITKTANLAKYYAGISYLRIGDFDNAVKYLKDFKTADVLAGSVKYSSLGDAYVELNDLHSAVKAYKKAISEFGNNFTSPILLKKTGIVYEEMDQKNEALKVYSQIKTDFPDSEEARDIDKYIARTK